MNSESTTKNVIKLKRICQHVVCAYNTRVNKVAKCIINALNRRYPSPHTTVYII